MKRMNILTAINRNYVTQLKVLLHSLFINNADREISIFLFHSELSDDELSSIEKTVKRYDGSFSPILMESRLKDIFSISKMFPPETFYRLMVQDYLPEHVDKVLYLDADMVICGSLAELYDTKMSVLGKNKTRSHYLFAAAPDSVETMPKTSEYYQNIIRRIGLKPPYKYVNAGVLLINLELFRKVVSTEEIIKIASDYKDILLFCDQDLINMVFYKYIKYLDKRYNFNPLIYTEMDEKGNDYPAIIHFFGDFKPWKSNFPLNRPSLVWTKQLYDKYAEMDL